MRHTRDALAPRSRVSWRSAVFAALVLFALVTLVVKVLHAEDTHTRHEEMELARQNAVATVVYSARREAQLSGLDSPHEANHASLSQPHATALEEASFTQPRAAAGAAARAQEAAAKAAVARVRDEQTTVGKATAAVRWQIGSPRTATTQPSPAEPEEAGVEVRVDSSGIGEQSRMETRSTTVDNLTLAIQAANLAPSGLPEGSRARCAGAPEQWFPLAGNAGVDGLPADAMNATTRFSAAKRTLLKPDLPHGPSSSVTGRRRLAAFDTAGTGGKKGVSCEYSAHMKAKQACAERQFLQRCEKESKTPKQKLTPWEQELATCLRGDAQCRATRAQLRAMAVQLQGVRMLVSTRPQCMLRNVRGGCASLHANAETGFSMGGCGQRGGGPMKGCNLKLGMELPQMDLTRQYQSCAVVGNSMNLFRTSNGAAIDRHEAVMRFNNEWERMQHVMREAGTLRPDTQAQHLGFKTTFRLLNRKYTNQMLDGEVDDEELSKDDLVVFWNYFSVTYLGHLQKQYPRARLFLFASDLANWQLSIFSQLRSDLFRLGLGPFECYRSMSSGVHGLFMSILMCDAIDLYGFSVSMENFKQGFNHGRPSESHSWQFETMLMRLLYFAGAVDVCNT